MSSQNNGNNRYRNGSGRQWNNNDDYRNDNNRNESDREGNFQFGRNREDFGNPYGERQYGNQFNQDRDWNNNQGMHGNQGGDMNRGDNYGQGAGRNWNDREFGNQGGYRNRFNEGGRNQFRNNDYNSQNSNEDRNWWNRTRDEVSSWFGDDDAQRRRNMDDQQQGQHRGKGPKGYTRTDERIKEDVNDKLSDDQHVDASEINVEVSSSEVTLSGTVKSRFEKRHAEELAEAVSGVKNVENRLRVSAETNAAATGSNMPASGTQQSGAGYKQGKGSGIANFEHSKS